MAVSAWAGVVWGDGTVRRRARRPQARVRPNGGRREREQVRERRNRGVVGCSLSTLGGPGGGGAGMATAAWARHGASVPGRPCGRREEGNDRGAHL